MSGGAGTRGPRASETRWIMTEPTGNSRERQDRHLDDNGWRRQSARYRTRDSDIASRGRCARTGTSVELRTACVCYLPDASAAVPGVVAAAS